jgi:hypothetical protein
VLVDESNRRTASAPDVYGTTGNGRGRPGQERKTSMEKEHAGTDGTTHTGPLQGRRRSTNDPAAYGLESRKGRRDRMCSSSMPGSHSHQCGIAGRPLRQISLRWRERRRAVSPYRWLRLTPRGPRGTGRTRSCRGGIPLPWEGRVLSVPLAPSTHWADIPHGGLTRTAVMHSHRGGHGLNRISY